MNDRAARNGIVLFGVLDLALWNAAIIAEEGFQSALWRDVFILNATAIGFLVIAALIWRGLDG